MFAYINKVSCLMVFAGTACLTLGINSALADNFVDLVPNSSVSVNLSDLVNGTVDGVVVGDKAFDEFSYSSFGDMPAAVNVNVFGFADADDNLGISFHGAFNDLPVGDSSEAQILFTVEVEADAQASGFVISDAHLFLGGIGVGDNSLFSVDETFEGSNESLRVFASTQDPTGQVLSDQAFFDPVAKRLRVTKTITAHADPNTNVPARGTVIDQSYSQEQIPEPATLSLLAISLTGVVLKSRRR